MTNTKSTCFISYCHSDIDENEIRFLSDIIKTNVRKTTEVFFDLDFGIGKRFQSFMKLLDEVDLVVMICTPHYKERTALGKEKGGGVGFEYDIIKTRYEKVIKEKKEKSNEYLSEREYNPFEVLPLIVKGDRKSSVPEDFLDNKSIDLTYYKVISKRSFIGESYKTLPQNIKTRFEKDIANVIGVLKTTYTIKQKRYEEALRETESLLKLDSLFRDTKADFKNPKHSDSKFEDALFVRTDVYKQIETQSAYFVIGRKGSGKSALTQVLPIRSHQRANPYFAVIDIYANRDINIHILYSFLNKDFISNSKHVFERIKCFKYAWALFFRLCVMNAIVKNKSTFTLSDFSQSKIKKMVDFLAQINKKNDNTTTDNTDSYFTYAFFNMERFMKRCIDEARRDDSYFMSDIIAQFNFENFIEFTIGKKISNELNEYLENLPTKFLITFDGFDTEIEKFREEGEYFEGDNLEEKVKFEIDWLHSLLLLVNDIKQMRTGMEILDEKLDFCITIPNHRYLEIIRNDIDSYRFQHRRKNLIWTGIELLIFLRKRLEILSDYRTRESSPWLSYREVLKNKFPYIPQLLEFEFNGRTIKIDLFLYVLRHTFWRPRDILLYFSHIIPLCKDSKDNEHTITSESIRSCIANLTFEIIKDDFKNEFKGTIRNLANILECFSRSKQILSFAEIESLLYNIPFEFAVPRKDKEMSLLDKIKYLYQIGFLGIKADRDIVERYNLYSSHIFIFNEGGKPFKKANKERIKEYSFIIHPIFSEYLELNTRENEFISEYTEDYILELEGYMRAANEDFALE